MLAKYVESANHFVTSIKSSYLPHHSDRGCDDRRECHRVASLSLRWTISTKHRYPSNDKAALLTLSKV